ncbi:MAG: hypothetical protein AMJ46_02030 [Latescibacteria bacterium DG_63]|nr:MAG: hypothetical protein AMJ46_02030 [Latescibacteria bacterium DG_63]
MTLKTRVWPLAALAVLISSSVGLSQETAEQVQLFEPLEAIQDADPEQRHWEVLRMPSELIVESKDNGTHIGFDSSSVHTIKVTVGHKMVVGCEWILYYFDGTEQVELRRNTGGSLEVLLGSGRDVVQGLDKIVESQGSLQLIAELTMFETDIPPQHMWIPRKGRYRPLWRGLATGVLTGKK